MKSGKMSVRLVSLFALIVLTVPTFSYGAPSSYSGFYKKVGPTTKDAALYFNPDGTYVMCDWSRQAGVYRGNHYSNPDYFVLNYLGTNYEYLIFGNSQSFKLEVNGIGAGDYTKVSTWKEATSDSPGNCPDITPPECNKDCAGVCDGTAYTDSCGSCVGGTTGKSPCACSSKFDCAGVCGGNAYIDHCGACVSGTTGKVQCPDPAPSPAESLPAPDPDPAPAEPTTVTSDDSGGGGCFINTLFNN